MDRFDPFDPSSTQDMWAMAAALRRRNPVARLGSEVVYVSRYRDARAVLRAPLIFSSVGGFKADGVYVPIGDASLGDFDEPEHGPYRRLAMAAAGPTRVQGERDFAATSARALIERMVAHGARADIVSTLALPLSSIVIAHLLGAPFEDAERLFGWAEDIMTSQFPTQLKTERGVGYHGAFPEYAAFVDELIDRRLHSSVGHDDAITRIIAGIMAEHDDPSLPDARAEIFMIVSTLLLGGVTTTRDFIGWLFYELIRRPDTYRKVRADRTLVPVAVEESLRLCPPLLYLMRKCTKEAEVAGTPVYAGERVLVGIASANRDEDTYESGDEFRLDRRDPPPSLSFGHGIHMCVGSGLARLEGEALLNAFLDRFDAGDVEIEPGFDPPLMPVPFMYGPARVEAVLHKR